MEIVAADSGGTLARCAIAQMAGGSIERLGEAVTLRNAEYAALRTAWEAFADQHGRPLGAGGIAVACPVDGEVLKFTNDPWMVRPRSSGASSASTAGCSSAISARSVTRSHRPPLGICVT